MKFLLDENCNGFEKKLLKLGHNVELVTELKKKDVKFRNDQNVISYADTEGYVLITKDKEPGRGCEDNKIPCIWISDERIFDEMIEPRLLHMQNSS